LRTAVYAPNVGLFTATSTGFKVQITNYDASYDWSGTAAFGTVTVSTAGLVTVTGVAAGTASVVTISASKAGFTPSTVSATAVALSAAAAAESRCCSGRGRLGRNQEIKRWIFQGIRGALCQGL